MKMDKIANSGNDEFYTPRYAVEPLLKYLPKEKIIWCPFDTEESLIVKTLKEKDLKVNATHIKNGEDFFSTQPQGEIIISNPPYSKKFEVFEKLFELNIPFAMLVGVVGLFESQKRFNLFSKNKFEIMWLNKRISYFKSYEEQKPSVCPPFSSVWLCKQILPCENLFETVLKN